MGGFYSKYIFHKYNTNQILNFPGVRMVASTLDKVISVVDWETSKLCKTNAV